MTLPLYCFYHPELVSGSKERDYSPAKRGRELRYRTHLASRDCRVLILFPLLKNYHSLRERLFFNGGERGIRTLGTIARTTP